MKKSLKQKILNSGAYAFLTATLITAGSVISYIKGHNRGYDNCEEERKKGWVEWGRVGGRAEGKIEGRKEGYELGRKERSIVIESVDIHNPETPALRRLTGKEYYQRLFVYQLERKAIRDACKTAAENYREQGRHTEALQMDCLRERCINEIAIIEEEFRERK
jgi:hypothetical protein